MDGPDPVFNLTYGLDASATKRINPRYYGNRTFSDIARHRFSVFTAEQRAAIPSEACVAIAAYLQYKAQTDPFAADSINLALANYWLKPEGAAGGKPSSKLAIAHN